jgi:hypothetical protein
MGDGLPTFQQAEFQNDRNFFWFSHQKDARDAQDNSNSKAVKA